MMQSQMVAVSGKWARHLFDCSVEHILEHCHGGCCEGANGIMVCLLPAEVVKQEAAGFATNGELLLRDTVTGKCPHKLASGLCAVHDTDLKPFGCIASPFTLNRNDTLIVRYRYSRMKCHGEGKPAYVVFRSSLDLLFGVDEAERVCAELAKGVDRVRAEMPRQSYENLKYLDAMKTPGGGK